VTCDIEIFSGSLEVLLLCPLASLSLCVITMFSNFSALLPLLQHITLSFASSQQVLKNDNTGPFTSEFGQLVNETLNLFHVPGISIAVVDGDKVWAEVSCLSIDSQRPFKLSRPHCLPMLAIGNHESETDCLHRAMA
jgi:hypothetical protein